ncbi:MAG: hypothetical protein QG652_1497 [Pseudomonadota bacterium]|nr:hypothetical protein [Pseudomonadota bacterium]
MTKIFSEHPGHRERYLKRKYNNPLFGANTITLADIEKAQQDDATEAQQFLNRFRDLVKQAVDFKPAAEADVILKLKEQLDKSYEQCAGLPGDQNEIKSMLKRLLHAIMQAMWKGIGNDPRAQEKLEMEEQARSQHFTMLEQPLVADLLRPDSLIEEHELVPALLSESAPAMNLAMQLFSPAQQIALYQQASELLKSADAAHPAVQQAQMRLTEMQSLLQTPGSKPN